MKRIFALLVLTLCCFSIKAQEYEIKVDSYTSLSCSYDKNGDMVTRFGWDLYADPNIIRFHRGFRIILITEDDFKTFHDFLINCANKTSNWKKIAEDNNITSLEADKDLGFECPAIIEYHYADNAGIWHVDMTNTVLKARFSCSSFNGKICIISGKLRDKRSANTFMNIEWRTNGSYGIDILSKVAKVMDREQLKKQLDELVRTKTSQNELFK